MIGVQLAYIGGELLVPGLFLAAVGFILIGLALFWPASAKPVVTSVAPVETMILTPNGAMASTSTGAVSVFTHSITWPALVDPAAGELDEAERRRVVDGLGIVGDSWCAGILAQAFDEEEGDLRVAVIEALGQSDGDVVAATLARAYSSYAVNERYAAIDGASRRADVPLLERALRDTDGTVALAAAYGLHRANRHDLIDANLAGRTDARAAEIRRVLPILA